MVRKILLLGLLAGIVASCSQERRWSDEQRREMRKELRQFRDRNYLKNMDDPAFDRFSEVVVGEVEEDYPDYQAFVAMPAVQDTVTWVVVSVITDDLAANYRNMRYMFPYRELVAQSILPDGLTEAQQDVFYSCMAKKINRAYGSLDEFVLNAIVADSTVISQQIAAFQQQCAADTGLQVAAELPLVE